MTRVYLIRHAEAEGNLYRRAHGWYDALITENGYRQIEALERRFADIHVDAVYSSDLFRTKTTASAIWRPKRLELVTEKQLREILLGDWEDKPWAEIAYPNPESLERFNVMDPEWSVPGAESLGQVRERIETAIREIAARHEGQTVAIISHGCAIRCVLGAFHGLSLRESAAMGHSDNTAVSLLEFEGDSVRVVFENDNSHLPEEISTLARQNWWKREGKPSRERSLWFCPMNLKEDAEYYLRAQRELRLKLYGSSEEGEEAALLEKVLKRTEKDPESTMCAMLGGEKAGILHMDFDRSAEKGIGHISFCHIEKELRNRGFGLQLIGQAVSASRARGREYLQLNCAKNNEGARHFYLRCGFYPVGEKQGSHGPVELMEKYIGYKDLRE